MLTSSSEDVNVSMFLSADEPPSCSLPDSAFSRRCHIQGSAKTEASAQGRGRAQAPRELQAAETTLLQAVDHHGGY